MLVLIIAAIAIRTRINFATEYMPGNNGAYYLVQIREVIESFKLAYNDFPLIFWTQGVIALALHKLGLGSVEYLANLVARLFDSIIPALAIVPAFLLVKKLAIRKNAYVVVTFSAFAILYFSPLTLVSDFQKNALGMLWLFFMLNAIYSFYQKSSIKNIINILFFFFLCSITHYGSFAAAITILVVAIVLRYAINFKLAKTVKIIAVVLFLVSSAIGLVYYINPFRAISLINIPLNIFENPVLVLVLNKEPVLSPLDILNMILVNGIALLAIILYKKKKINVETKEKGFFFALIILSLFFSSPLLGIESAQRLSFMSYLTLPGLFAFLFNSSEGVVKKYIVLFCSALLVCSAIIFIYRPVYSNMNKELEKELQYIASIINNQGPSLIVTRHGMEYWTKWVTRKEALREDALVLEHWKAYGFVLFLQQKNSHSPFGPAGSWGPKFTEPVIPLQSKIIFDGNHFSLYKSSVAPADISIYQNKRF